MMDAAMRSRRRGTLISVIGLRISFVGVQGAGSAAYEFKVALEELRF